FKPYREDMRKWIAPLKEGENAFDNSDPLLRPHRIVDGEIVYNVNKNGDKYKRQSWDKIAPCVHTRNDIISSQNTIHPIDDRVFSIRELMLMMNIPENFRWIKNYSFEDLNKLNKQEKRKILKENEINIRQSIGEAVPTIILEKIAYNIKEVLNNEKYQKESKFGNKQLQFSI
ncbi:DNA cytosine methyltransferase, partial [Staphylococcus warneri]